MDIQQTLQQARQILADSSPSAVLDAEVLLTFTLQCNSAHLHAWPEKKLNSNQQSQYQQLLHQRQQGVPIAYLTGRREFWSLNFAVNNSTLIPRPETETLVEYILTNFNSSVNHTLLDLGTGTGAIAIAIAVERPEWKVYASDTSEQTLQLARKNSNFHQTGNVTFIHSNWFKDIAHRDFDIIVSNPPYIADNDPHLQQGDLRFEPRSALSSGATGMDDIEHICQQAKDFLGNNGRLIIEHGYNQKELVAECFADNGYTEIEQHKDLSGQTRMTAGKKS